MKRQNCIALAVIATLASGNVFAAGYEKATLWSARYAPIGGAATAIVNDSEATFFNPAGLAAMSEGFSASANFSPTFSHFLAPVLPGGAQVQSSTGFSPIFGVNAAYKMSNGFSFGLNSGVAGGTRSNYKGIAVPGDFNEVFPSIETNLTLLEHSLGVGYEVLPGLRIGAAWRVMQVQADFAAFTTATVGAQTFLASLNYQDLSATKYNGFRLGAQYAPADAGWGVGATFRSGVGFTAESTNVDINLEPASGSRTDISNATGSISNEFPFQLSIGAFKTLGEEARKVVLEWTFTQYAANAALLGSNNATVPGGTTTAGPTGDAGLQTAIRALSIPQNWRNQHNLRVGYDYTPAEGLAYRAGYVLTSQVTPDNRARPGFSSPGLGHTFLVGGGYGLSQNLSVNAGLEYSRASGEGSTPRTGGDIAGTFASNAYAMHLGASLRF